MRRGSSGTGRGHRDAKQRVGAEPALGRSAVDLDETAIEGALVERVPPERFGNLAVDVGDGRSDAAAKVATPVAVSKLERFVFAG